MLRSTLALALALVGLGLVPACGTAPPPTTAPAPAAPVTAEPAAFELVETVPIETTLDHPNIADAAEVWLAMIHSAQHSIDLAQFYASNQAGSRLEPIVAAIEAALRSSRGSRISPSGSPRSRRGRAGSSRSPA